MPREPSSRALLLPGPQPPLSHLGVTLLRHAVGTGLRYAFHQLGLPMPERPPVRILRLRLYLDGEALAAVLHGAGGGGEVCQALLDPGGAGRLPDGARRLDWAARFHRARLCWVPGWRRAFAATAPAAAGADRPDAAPWREFRAGLARALPRLGDAVLAETVAALARRARRAAGDAVAPAWSREARRFATGQRCRLERLGPPDLARPSWAETGPAAAPAAAESAPVSDRLRGRFREAWRETLDALRPSFLELARSAVEHGLLESPGDAFFIPFDLADHLAAERPPSWLAAAIARNRAEHDALLEIEGLPEVVTLPLDHPTAAAEDGAWDAAPLAPLP